MVSPLQVGNLEISCPLCALPEDGRRPFLQAPLQLVHDVYKLPCAFSATQKANLQLRQILGHFDVKQSPSIDRGENFGWHDKSAHIMRLIHLERYHLLELLLCDVVEGQWLVGAEVPELNTCYVAGEAIAVCKEPPDVFIETHPRILIWEGQTCLVQAKRLRWMHGEYGRESVCAKRQSR